MESFPLLSDMLEKGRYWSYSTALTYYKAAGYDFPSFSVAEEEYRWTGRQ